MNEFNYDVNSFWTGPTLRFKGGGGGGGGGAPDPNIAETAEAAWAKTQVYPLVTNAIEGGGFGTPEFASMQRSRMQTGLAKSFDQTKREFSSQLNRSVHKEDTRVRNFAGASLDRAYTTSKDQMNRQFRASDVADKTMGMQMAGEFLANEQRIGVGNMQAYNNALATSMNTANTMGTFGTNIASGVGQGMMDYNFAQKMGAS